MMDFAGGGLGPTQCCADVQCERGHAEGAGQGVYGLAGEAVGDHGAHILGLAGGTILKTLCQILSLFHKFDLFSHFQRYCDGLLALSYGSCWYLPLGAL
jgi:hypothetical protein